MDRTRRNVWATTLVGVGIAAALVLPSAAQEPPIAVELLTPRSTFTDDVSAQFRVRFADGGPTRVLNAKDASRTAVAKITVQPGARFPWHTHPGPVIVNVTDGAFVYVQADDCVHRPYGPGTAFVDPGHGNVHSAYNPSTNSTTTLIATFYEAPAEGPLTITDGVEEPTDCDLEVGDHASH